MITHRHNQVHNQPHSWQMIIICDYLMKIWSPAFTVADVTAL